MEQLASVRRRGIQQPVRTHSQASPMEMQLELVAFAAKDEQEAPEPLHTEAAAAAFPPSENS